MGNESEQDHAEAGQGGAPGEIGPGSGPDAGPPDAGQEDDVLSLDEIAEPAPKKRRFPPSRIAFLAFVAVAAVVIVLELSARWGYTRTIEALNEAWEPAQESSQGLYREDVDKLIHGWPWREYDEKTRKETLTWRGLRAHRLEVEYGSMGFVQNYRTLERGQ
jgi:hypothetical protein